MGSSSNRPLKRKKKGRPSLLDLEKRNLRLQNPNPNPSPNPNPNPNPSSNSPATRRSTRANPAAAADDDDDDSSTGNRREKKLKLVHRLPLRPANSASDLASSASDSGAADPEEVEEHNSAPEAADPLREPEVDQAVTPLPDRKLLEFILDRLQKKDTYSVFSEPVDPEELPDYRDVIEHPMDFGTVRKKLLGGAYADLEQFEKDVFLISSNAMQYNAPSTIYFRQARAIQELAKKNFENLRQESDDNEPEPKTVRRGRPPIKNIIKRTVGRSAAEHTGSDFSSDASPAGDNSHLSNMAQDLSRKVSTLDRSVSVGISTRSSHGLCNTEAYSWSNEQKSDRSEDYSASVMRTLSMKNGKKLFVAEEDRRSTYKLPQLSDCAVEASVLTTFDGEKKLLVPVGVHLEHAYARSLARFAAKLGTIGWEIAAKRIQRVLPRTKFGRGWVGDGEPHQKPQQLFTSSQHLSSEPMIPTCTTVPKTEQNSDGKEVHAANLAAEQAPDTTISPSTSPAVRDRSSDVVENNNYLRGSSHGGCNVSSGGGGSGPKVPFQIQQNSAIQRSLNGFKSGYGYNQLSQVERMVKPLRPHDSIGTDAIVMTHSRVLDMVSRNNSSVIHQSCVSQLDADKSELAGAQSAINSSSPSADSAQDLQGQQQDLLLNPRHGAVPPDLNVGFQSSGSPVSGMPVDSQHPDLALQL